MLDFLVTQLVERMYVSDKEMCTSLFKKFLPAGK